MLPVAAIQVELVVVVRSVTCVCVELVMPVLSLCSAEVDCVNLCGVVLPLQYCVGLNLLSNSDLSNTGEEV